MNTYLLPHLGLGDYIVVNGLIRNIIKRAPNKSFVLFCNELHKESICFMFRDIKNLKFSFVPPIEMNEKNIRSYIHDFVYELILIGYHHLDYKTTTDRMFYKQFGVDFQKRWSDFYVERDQEREKNLFNHYNVKEQKYIFLHEGGSANENFIDRSKITTNLPIIEPIKNLTKNIFDYCYLIENAAEIQVIQSSFFLLIDSISPKGKLFAHQYSRKLYDYTKANVNKEWTIYE